jgi:hypothetical protein
MKALKLILVVSILFLSDHCPGQTLRRVLIVTGGHDFEREAFFDIFRDMPDVEFKEASQPQANQLYDSQLVDSFDVLLFYDMVQEINGAQKKAFIHMLK